MANPRALAIKAARAQSEAQAGLDVQTKLLVAICEKLGLNVREILSGELPDFSEPTEAVEPTDDNPSEFNDTTAGSLSEAKAFKAASASKK